MLSAVIDVHRNILSAQCFVKYEVRKTPVNNMQILCTTDSLLVSLFQDEDLFKEVKVLTPDNFFIPNSVSTGDAASCLVEIKSDNCRIHQKSHYSKYRKVIERHLESLETCENENYHKRLKIDREEGFIEGVKDYVSNYCELQELDYSEHCLPVEDVIEVRFRLQLSSSDVIPDSLTDPDSLLTLYEYFKTEIQSDIPYVAVCSTCCKSVCSTPMYFQNVKEFASSFSDLSESWFCHKSITPHSSMSDKTLYVSDAYIYLPTNVLDTFSIAEKGSQVLCENCHSVLAYGEEFDSARKIFKCFFGDAIVFKKSEDCINGDLHLKSVMLCLWSMINHKQLPLCRLFLQAKLEDNEDTCLLLWVPSVKVAQFKIQTSVDAMPRKMNFTTEAVYKAQYHQGSLSSPQVVSWSKDFNVDFHRVSSHFMQTVVDILRASSECIPGGKIESSGFLNGCIPCMSSYIKDI